MIFILLLITHEHLSVLFIYIWISVRHVQIIHLSILLIHTWVSLYNIQIIYPITSIETEIS